MSEPNIKMTEKQAFAIAGKAIMSQMSFQAPNPIEFEWTKIVAREFMKRYNNIAEDCYYANLGCIEERSRDEDADKKELIKKMKNNLKPVSPKELH